MSKSIQVLALSLCIGSLLPFSTQAAEDPKGVGYRDTPIIPNQPWKVHDADRPVPKVITPGATFSDKAPAPSDAIVLFDGTDLSKWTGKDDKASWKVENGYMEANKTGSIRSREQFSDFQLHIEWATPEEVKGDSQGRVNSGVLIFGKYEVQVLDSYNNRSYADGQAGALYGQYPPLVNATRGPGQWQTYEIIFEAPRWDAEGKLTKPANVTVILNGVLLHHKKEYIGETKHRAVAVYGKPQSAGPIELQDHNNPTRFRNIWIRPLGEYDKP